MTSENKRKRCFLLLLFFVVFGSYNWFRPSDDQLVIAVLIVFDMSIDRVPSISISIRSDDWSQREKKKWMRWMKKEKKAIVSFSSFAILLFLFLPTCNIRHWNISMTFLRSIDVASFLNERRQCTDEENFLLSLLRQLWLLTVSRRKKRKIKVYV